MTLAPSSLIGAIEAGGTKFVLAIADGTGTILSRARVPTTTPSETFSAVQSFFDQASARFGTLDAFGVASFGPLELDPNAAAFGMFTTTPKPGWTGASWQDALGAFSTPIGLDTDVNGAAIGEWRLGAGRDCATVAYATIGTGVGAGVVRDGRSVMGFAHLEAGHIYPRRVDLSDDFAGVCPFHGDCVEGLASGPAILRRWGASLDQLDPQGGALEHVASYLSDLVVSLTLLHTPDRLVLGGGVMKAPGLLEAIRAKSATKLNGYIRHARLEGDLSGYLVSPQLGDDAGLVGAVELGRRSLYTARP